MAMGVLGQTVLFLRLFVLLKNRDKVRFSATSGPQTCFAWTNSVVFFFFNLYYLPTFKNIEILCRKIWIDSLSRTTR